MSPVRQKNYRERWVSPEQMCGRFALTIVHGFFARFAVMEYAIELFPRYNIAPTQDVPIVVRESPNRAVMMRWGLIPFWAKDPKIGNRLINATAETLATKPAFRVSLKRKRCLVPATGFYEWKRTDEGKEPYYVRLKDGSYFTFAGLYDRWIDPKTGKETPSFTIVTTVPNGLMETIHNRMPVMLREDDESEWLSNEPLPEDDLKRLFKPFPARSMEAYRVSTDVNSPANESPRLVEPM